jgi:hypothetical protein
MAHLMSKRNDLLKRNHVLKQALGLERPNYGVQMVGNRLDQLAAAETKLEEAWGERFARQLYGSSRLSGSGPESRTLADLRADCSSARKTIKRFGNTSAPLQQGAQAWTMKDIVKEQKRLKTLMDKVWIDAGELNTIVSELGLT